MMRALAVLGLMLLAVPAVAQEKFVNSDASVRTTLDFKVPAAQIQKLLPDGWEIDSPTTGASTGSNLRVTFIEGVWGEDPQGKALPQGRNVVIGSLVKKKGSEAGGLMLVGGLTAGNPPGVYGVYSKATTTSQRTLRTGGDGVATTEEVWNAKADTGDAIDLQLQYVRGTPVRGKIDIRVYSGAKPEFYRIYRYTYGADVPRGVGTSPERVKAFSFKAAGPKLGPLFEGAEIVAITALPYYSRQVFLPGS
jgi:hypothetical protein